MLYVPNIFHQEFRCSRCSHVLKFESVILRNCHSGERAVLNYYVRLSSMSKKLKKMCTRLIILYYCSYLGYIGNSM